MFSSFVAQETTLSILLSIAGFVLSVLTLTGCQYTRMYFEAPNDADHIYFTPRNYLGVGFFGHQDFTRTIFEDWTEDETCYEYSDWEKARFKTPNFVLARNASVAAAVFGGLAFTSLIVLKVYFSQTKKSSSYFASFMFVSIACMLQWAGVVMFFEGSDEICDEARYGVLWSMLYPHGTHPEYSKFTFFSHCSIGPRGKLAIAATSLYGVALFFLAICMCCETAVLPEDSWEKNDAAEAESVEKFDEEADVIPKAEVFQSSPARSIKSAISVLKGTMIEDESDGPKTYNLDAVDVDVNDKGDKKKVEPDVEEVKDDDISYAQSERVEDLGDDVSMDPSRTGDTIL